jgi:hypothetical protein
METTIGCSLIAANGDLFRGEIAREVQSRSGAVFSDEAARQRYIAGKERRSAIVDPFQCCRPFASRRDWTGPYDDFFLHLAEEIQFVSQVDMVHCVALVQGMKFLGVSRISMLKQLCPCVLRELIHQVATDDGFPVEGECVAVTERVGVVFDALAATCSHWLANYVVAAVISSSFSNWKSRFAPSDVVEMFARRELTPVTSDALFAWCRPPTYLAGHDDSEAAQRFSQHLLAQLAIGTPWGPPDLCWEGAATIIQRFVLRWNALTNA